MLVEGQKIEVRWHPANRKRYEDQGYAFTKYGDYLYVNPSDLPIGSHVKVKFICDYCGKEFYIKWYDYNGREKGSDCCHSCASTKHAENTLKERQIIHYNRLKKICKEKGYSLLTRQEEIVNSSSLIKYECPIHGIQEVRLDCIAQGAECPKCGYVTRHNTTRLSPVEAQQRVNKLGGKIINPNDYVNIFAKNLYVTCPKCHKPFLSSLARFCQHGGQLCGECESKESMGEKKIREYLESKCINFNQEHCFSDCKDERTLPFDFYLPRYDVAVEYDGQGHYFTINYWGEESFKKTQKHDKMKNKYCHDHDIKLIRIPYTKFNHIEEILDKELEPYVKDIV